MGIIITDKTDDKKKYRRSYEDYEELPETQAGEEIAIPDTSEPQQTTEPATEPAEPTEAEN